MKVKTKFSKKMIQNKNTKDKINKNINNLNKKQFLNFESILVKTIKGFFLF